MKLHKTHHLGMSTSSSVLVKERWVSGYDSLAIARAAGADMMAADSRCSGDACPK